MRAIIDWIPHDQGGRFRLPSGAEGSYTTVVRFLDESWPGPVAWSLVIDKISGDRSWVADVRFLADDAPHEGLIPGRQFELYEGARRVAYGTIGIYKKRTEP